MSGGENVPGGDSEEMTDRRLQRFFSNPGKIPCLRKSFLTGITSGLGIGIAYFFFTSNTKRATHFGFGGYMLVTLGTWFYCRYTVALQKVKQRQIMQAMQKSILVEGPQDA